MRNIYEDIEKFVFIKDEPQKSDIIFVPGGAFAQPCELAAQLYKSGFAPLILPSGKYSVHRGYFPGAYTKKEIYPFVPETEWAFIREVLIQNGVAEKDILKEDEAQSTYDNARFSKSVTDKAGLIIKRAIVCCKSIHARRAYMYYQYFYPEAEILLCPAEVEGISSQDWQNTALGIHLVMQEVEKCGKQFATMLCKQKLGTDETPDILGSIY